MKRYIVLDKNYNFQGTLADKKDLALFKVQRDMNYFKIFEMTDDEFEEKIGSVSMLRDRDAFLLYGYLVFPDEEIMMFEGFDQMQNDFMSILTKFLRDSKPFIHFKDDEIETVETFLSVIHSTIKESNMMMHDSEEVYEHNNYYKMELMTKTIVDSFGGRN